MTITLAVVFSEDLDPKLADKWARWMRKNGFRDVRKEGRKIYFDATATVDQIQTEAPK